MAVSSNSLSEFSRDQLLTMAFQLAGVANSEQDVIAADLTMAARFLNLELAALQAEGALLRSIERTTLTITPPTASYTLPSDVIDVVVGPNGECGSILPTSGGESIVYAMSRQDYSNISDKTTTNTARPTRVYVEKNGTTGLITVIFHPAPETASTTWRYQKVRLLRAMDSGSVTLDLPQKWQKAVTYACAAAVARAKSLPLETVNSLRKEAEMAKAKALADDAQRGPLQFRVKHRGRSMY